MFKRRKPSAAPPRPPLRARADAARDARDWRAAAALYEQHLAGGSSDDRAALWVQLGHCRKEAGDLAGALAAYGQAVALAPEGADAHLQLGHLHKVAGRHERARDSYAAALRLDPGCGDARAELAQLAGEPRHGGAPADPPRAQLLAHADAARDAGRWSDAAALYAEHLAGAPAEPRAAWIQLGHARKEAGDRDGAVMAYEAALILDPDDAETHLHLGHLHKAMGAVGAAVDRLAEALRLAPQLTGVERDLRDLAALAPSPPVERTPAAREGDLRRAFPLPWTGDRGVFRSPFPPIHAGLSRRFPAPDADAP